MSPDLLVIREEALDLAEDVRRRVDNVAAQSSDLVSAMDAVLSGI